MIIPFFQLSNIPLAFLHLTNLSRPPYNSSVARHWTLQMNNGELIGEIIVTREHVDNEWIVTISKW